MDYTLFSRYLHFIIIVECCQKNLVSDNIALIKKITMNDNADKQPLPDAELSIRWERIMETHRRRRASLTPALLKITQPTADRLTSLGFTFEGEIVDELPESAHELSDVAQSFINAFNESSITLDNPGNLNRRVLIKQLLLKFIQDNSLESLYESDEDPLIMQDVIDIMRNLISEA